MQREIERAVRGAKNAISTAKKQYIVYALRDTIKHFRKQRTASEEREFVKKQMAQIRDLAKQEDRYFRRRNVAKLVFFYLNGYNVDFGAMECVKLIASAKFKDKRIGYMAIQVLLDERSEVLLLATNVLKQDLQSDNHQVVALALHLIANIASTDMARDLAADVERLLHSRNAFLRKKAALAAVRMCRRSPELADTFVAAALEMLRAQRNHGVLLCGLALVQQLATLLPDTLVPRLRTELLPPLLETLREVATAGFDAEFGFQGVNDPFLQCRLLAVLRLLTRDGTSNTDELQSTLVQVARSSDKSSAVLYECIHTILAIRGAPRTSLSFAVQRLGDLLRSRDPNLRLMALQSMREAATLERASVVQHQTTIVECLHDPDPSAQRGAVDVLFDLIAADNARAVFGELIGYLAECTDDAVRLEVLRRLWLTADQQQMEVGWRMEAFVRAFQAVDTAADAADEDGWLASTDDLASALLALIAAHAALPSPATRRLVAAARSVHDATGKVPTLLLRCALWCVGEYGYPREEVRPSATSSASPTTADDGSALAGEMAELSGLQHSQRNSDAWDGLRAPHEDAEAGVAFVEAALEWHERRRRRRGACRAMPAWATAVESLALTAVMKIAVRSADASDGAVFSRCRELLARRRTALDAEVQQRACEFTALLQPEQREWRERLSMTPSPLAYAEWSERWRARHAHGVVHAPVTGTSSLIVLDDEEEEEEEGGSGNGGRGRAGRATGRAATSTSTLAADLQDLLSMGDGPFAAALPPADGSDERGLLDLLSSPEEATSTPVAPNGSVADANVKAAAETLIFDSDVVGIWLSARRSTAAHTVDATARFVNKSPRTLSEFLFQVAVPKYILLEMSPATAGALPPTTASTSPPITQRMRLVNESGHFGEERPLQMRFRISYVNALGERVAQQGTVDTFPTS
ncbi:hypothetical protein CDCA_CDCA02G0720 [Cyanidium caldarium]|uniref:AP-1 complex subunit gamma n=1 Tax=Cyanidium caldarium TaxID=2771 RepID=A0AAV9IQV8_CYACA|nr:hypothetical protein CDCA_CDCA02G0720 [Cyanidium caldarium]